MISRGNPLFFRTFPRLINTNSLSLFCAKWLFYPLSRKIVIRYFVRNDIFNIFAAEIILFSCKFHQTIILFSCKFHQTIILFSCKECIIKPILEKFIMKRKIYDKLVEWKQQRKGETALMVEGARRVGKSYILENHSSSLMKYNSAHVHVQPSNIWLQTADMII